MNWILDRKVTLLRSAIFVVLVVYGTLAGKYSDLDYSVITSQLDNLKGDYLSVSTAHSRYDHQVVQEGHLSCTPYIVSISDQASLRNDVSRPQVLISGEIHGDERVGPLVSVALAELMGWSADCTIRHDREACATLDKMEVTPAQRTWLAFLSTRRETIIVPTANCMGYMKNMRNDGGFDPNRDYPYSRHDSRCMMSSSARLFKALMESSIIQSVVTFHGGMVALGYEWGSRNHLRPKDASPDHQAHKGIAELMRDFAGTFKNEVTYPVGPINTLIYPVEGGMEDWLYAAGWDKGPLRDCTGNAAGQRLRPRTRVLSAPASEEVDGEPANLIEMTGRKLAEHVGENRAVVFLVETSDRKKPQDSALGGSLKILDPNGEQNGHVPRNVRLSLAAIDMVQPYVCLSQVSLAYNADEAPTARNVRRLYEGEREGGVRHGGNGNGHLRRSEARWRQMQARDNTSHDSTSSFPHDSTENVANSEEPSRPVFPAPEHARQHTDGNAAGIELEWYVGGALKVDCTFLAWHHNPSGGSAGAKDRSGSNWSKYMATLDTAAVQATFASACKPTTRRLNNLRDGAAGQDASTGAYTTAASFPVVASKVFSGASRWAKSTAAAQSPAPIGTNSTESVGISVAYEEEDPLRPLSTYRSTAWPHHSDTQKVFAPGRYWLVAWSMADQHYGAAGQGYPADMPPQSHLANVRTNPAWHKSAGHRSIHGRLFWPSDPVEVVVHSNGSYHVASTVTHCAWWDRAQIEERDVQDAPRAGSVAGWFGGRNTSGIAEGLTGELIKNMFDPAAYRSAGEQSTSAYKLYGVTLGLLLIMVVCCVVLYKMWRRSSIYTQVSSNKFANFSTLKTFRGRVTMNTLWSPTKQ